jgi:hypothetical protein
MKSKRSSQAVERILRATDPASVQGDLSAEEKIKWLEAQNHLLRHFAGVHNIPFATWQREFRRGAAGPILRRGNRWTCPEYEHRQGKGL